eukprot:TRINITY_DN4818_c0_g1_i1.p1 TRINITY_DN4818_c0_g1~~TRINITY_DN4818_c0_g1_i1.p1  ORF type:complete len:81 (-),score=5.71 TRINITY_DN4818_c0_g1_i1:157-399(-)
MLPVYNSHKGPAYPSGGQKFTKQLKMPKKWDLYLKNFKHSSFNFSTFLLALVFFSLITFTSYYYISILFASGNNDSCRRG